MRRYIEAWKPVAAAHVFVSGRLVLVVAGYPSYGELDKMVGHCRYSVQYV